MGQAIVYCGKCQIQLRSADFEKGAAFKLDGQGLCKKCAQAMFPPERLANLSTPMEAPLAELHLRVAPAREAPPRKSIAPLAVAGGIVAALLLTTAIVVFVSKSSLPVEMPPPVVVEPPKPPVTPVERPGPPPRREEPKVVEPRPPDRRPAELAALEEKVRTSLEAQDLVAAKAAIEEFRKLEANRAPELEKKLADAAARAYPTLREKALDAQKRKAAAEVQEVRSRVAGWGMPSLAADLEQALAAVVVPPSEVDTYRLSWTAALEPAAGRDYAAAIRALLKTSEGLQDPALKAEAAADVQSLRALQGAVDEALRQLAKTPKGQKITLEYWTESGQPRKVEGTVVRADSNWIELKAGDERVPVPLGELALRLAGKPGALLCALEGDAEGRKGAPLEDRFLAYAPAAGPREEEARRLFWAAERENSAPATTGEAIRKFGTLLKDFGATALVRRNRGAIQARTEGGKEYFFFADQLQGQGRFRLGKHSKVGPCWVSEGGTGSGNFVEIEFSAVAQADYRCWAYVGGCCAETITVYYQATELVKDGAAVEPGGPSGALAPHAISTGARRHAGHAAAKEATRWGWVSLPLPKYSAPGVKKVRLLTEQPIFSVAYAYVASGKSAPPPDADIREREKSRPASPPPLPEIKEVSDANLAAWWKFEPGFLDRDSSKEGNHGTLAGGPAAVAGRVGKALEFDGTDDCMKVPSSPSISLKTREMSFAAWVFRKGNGAGKQTLLHRQRGGYVNDEFSLALADGAPFAVLFTRAGERVTRAPVIPAQQWAHLAATFDGTALRLYVNGAEAASDAGPAGTDFFSEEKPLTLGAAVNDDQGRPSEFFQGALDDVRIYYRTLTAPEVASLAGRR